MSIEKCNCIEFASDIEYGTLLLDFNAHECGQKSIYFYTHVNKPIGRCIAHSMHGVVSYDTNWQSISYEEALIWEVMNS